MNKIDRARIEGMCVFSDASIRQAMEVIGHGEIGTAFIIDAVTKRFIGLITDGDIRRALLKGMDLNDVVDEIERPQTQVASVETKTEEIAKLFGEKIRVIPILDHDKRIVDIAFYDQRVMLPVAQPSLGEKELQYVTDCIISNWISSTGKYVGRFEEAFAQFCGCRHSVATSNGTTALHLALLALGIGPGDEVIVPSLTFIATANAVSYTGARPVFVDSDLKTWNIDPVRIAQAVTPRTKAIIPVHLYGHPADMDPILNIARAHKLAVVEDAAEAHGAEYKGRKVGSIGDIGVFSFFGNKIITTGEGGMLVTNDLKIADKVRILRDHGMEPSKRYWHTVLGYNYRMTNVQAAIGLAQVERIDAIIASKLNVARRYEEQLSQIQGIVCPPRAEWAKNVYWLYSILIEKEFRHSRNELMKELALLGIDTRSFFPPVHRQPIYDTRQDLKVSEALSEKGLSLPSSAGLQSYEIDQVCERIRTIHARMQNAR